jgi:hypothetical protein
LRTHLLFDRDPVLSCPLCEASAFERLAPFLDIPEVPTIVLRAVFAEPRDHMLDCPQLEDDAH